MESLLDDKAPPESPPPGASFFKTKNIIAMLILFITLAFLFLPMGERSANTELAQTTATIAKQDNYIFEKNDAAKQKTTKLTNDDLDKKPKTELNEKQINPNHLTPQNTSTSSPIGGQWQPFPSSYLTNQTAKTSALPTSIFTEQFPSDGFFVEKIKSQLATYNQYREEEKVYLHFDRTMLKPGESLWFSVYVRNANTLLPSEKSDIVYVEFIAPNGGILKKLKLVAKNGVTKGDIQTSAEMAGGIYKIKAYTNWQRNFDSYFERKITLQKTVLPHLRMKLDFEKEAYGAGDEVVVKLDLNSLENTALKNFSFDYKVSLEGNIFSQQKSKTDNKGHAEIKFHLPKDLKTNDGLVNVLLKYHGQNESISRSIPIILNKMDIQFFPEGGDLVAGFEQEVAFKALNEFGKPADVEGVIMSANGIEITTFKSYHQGMGAFNFQPLYGGEYFAKITKPQNIKGTFPLPTILENGNTLHIANMGKEEMTVEIQSTDNQRLTLALQSQGKLINSVSTSAKAGKHLLKIPIKNAPIGIAQLTLFDEAKRPHAERLVFLNKNKTIKIQVTTDKNKYAPREKVSLKIEAKDENGNPVQGQFSVGVTDDKLLSFADDKQGKILAYLLLESDLKGEIEEPNFYFEAKEKHLDKDQNLALNYLMMTHGWRRFTWKDQADPIAQMAYPNEKAIITGTVEDIFGQPISGAVVGVEGLEETVLTDEQGQFVFENIPLQDSKKLKGNYATLVASKDGVGKTKINSFGKYVVKINNSSSRNIITKVIPTKGVRQIKGRVVDKTGEPLIGANVFLEGVNIGVAVDFDGNYIIKNVPLGTYILRSDYIGYQSVVETVTIR
ncbi:MAG TPA: hypothetical protein ENJ53_04335, partial [Phaeodactylibacter sp.]|nr:hypothetical protein [Phaeodactylibacter sp.]